MESVIVECQDMMYNQYITTTVNLSINQCIAIIVMIQKVLLIQTTKNYTVHLFSCFIENKGTNKIKKRGLQCIMIQLKREGKIRKRGTNSAKYPIDKTSEFGDSCIREENRMKSNMECRSELEKGEQL